jgi:hypothetical protein
MFGDGILSFHEFAMSQPHPLASIQEAVLEFLRGRDDAVLFGAQAVNAYVDEPRMTQDVDILSPRARELARELREYLKNRFHIAVRTREVGKGLGFRLFQVQKPRNRHLVDLRSTAILPPTQRIAEVLVVSPAELMAGKVRAYHLRRGKPKSFTDLRDLAVLLLTFPTLKVEKGEVRDRLVAGGADSAVLKTWKEVVRQEILPQEEDDDF